MDKEILKQLHDLKTPLTSLRLYSEALLREDCGPITPKQKEYLEDMYRIAGEMLEQMSRLSLKPKT